MAGRAMSATNWCPVDLTFLVAQIEPNAPQFRLAARLINTMNRLLLALAFAGVSSSSVWAQPKPVAKPPLAAPAAGGIAADVNGDLITVADLDRLIESAKANDSRLQPNSPNLQASLAEARKQMLDQLINTRLLVQEARRRKIKTPDTVVDSEIAGVKAAYNLKTDADLQKQLQADGKTIAQFRQFIADQSAMGELVTTITADVVASPDDIAKYYKAHPEQFAKAESIKARHILLAINPNASKADKDAVLKRAQNIIAQLKAKNADFAVIAKANSDDVGSKDQGGELGLFERLEQADFAQFRDAEVVQRAQMIYSVQDSCFKAKVNEIVGPIQSEFGLHIVRVDTKNAPSTTPLADVQADAEVKAFILKIKVQERLDQQIAKLRAAAKIQKFA